MTPTFIVPVAFAAIALIVWLVRAESKTNAVERELEKFKTQIKCELKEVEVDIKDCRTRFFEHAANFNFHHNEAAQAEFKTALERRMLGMESSLKDIGFKLDRIADKQ